MCNVPGCDRPNYHRQEYCNFHYQRIRLGIPLDKPKRALPGEGERFLASLIDTTETRCITWPFGQFKDGCGHAHHLGRSIIASRLMCILAHGEPPFDGAEAAHNCGRGHDACVNPNHLRWDTKVGNYSDKVAHGTQTRGEDHPVSKLSDADVIDIRSLYQSGRTQQSLADQFGVSRSNIGLIVTRVRWGHL